MNIYSEKAEERRKQFNRIINGCNMVLMNNIPEVDPSVYDNWQGNDPVSPQDCVFTHQDDDNTEKCVYHCETHGVDVEDDYEPTNCDGYYDEQGEVYQWFAIGDSDADFLKRQNQYITYSDMLDTYFLAITHFGTSWDYTSMVDDFEDCYHGLEGLNDEKEVV